jgi:hypothetical protein
MLIAIDHPKDFFLTTIGIGMTLILVLLNRFEQSAHSPLPYSWQ